MTENRPRGGAFKRAAALIVIVIIAILALTRANHTTPGISTLQTSGTEARHLTDAEVQSGWNAYWNGFKRGFVEKVK